MIDLSNKYFHTDSDEESERLLRIAVAQGYRLPKGLRVLAENRVFRFIGSPYKAVSVPNAAPNQKDAISFSEVFGNEDSELEDILLKAGKFCRAYGYDSLRIYADENESGYSVKAFAKTETGNNIDKNIKLLKPRKVTLDEIEKRFGCPVEIVP